MEIIYLSLIFSNLFGDLHPPAETPAYHGVTVEKGFEAYTGCEQEGKMYALKQNKLVRENGVLKIVRICGMSEKENKPTST